MDISKLHTDYLRYTNEVLPMLARQHNWPITQNHCLQRVLLDNLFEDVWYGHIPERPAYKQLTEPQLRQLILECKRLETEGIERIVGLNNQSLGYRQKQPTS